MSTPITEETANAWLEANPRLVQDQHNQDIMFKYINYLKSKGRESELSIEGLSAFVNLNSSQTPLKLRDESEIRKAAADAAAAPYHHRTPEPPKPEPRLKGLTVSERLASVGVQASHHVSHADKHENDQKQRSVWSEMAERSRPGKREVEHRGALAEAQDRLSFIAQAQEDESTTERPRRHVGMHWRNLASESNNPRAALIRASFSDAPRVPGRLNAPLLFDFDGPKQSQGAMA